MVKYSTSEYKAISDVYLNKELYPNGGPQSKQEWEELVLHVNKLMAERGEKQPEGRKGHVYYFRFRQDKTGKKFNGNNGIDLLLANKNPYPCNFKNPEELEKVRLSAYAKFNLDVKYKPLEVTRRKRKFSESSESEDEIEDNKQRKIEHVNMEKEEQPIETLDEEFFDVDIDTKDYANNSENIEISIDDMFNFTIEDASDNTEDIDIDDDIFDLIANLDTSTTAPIIKNIPANTPKPISV